MESMDPRPGRSLWTDLGTVARKLFAKDQGELAELLQRWVVGSSESYGEDIVDNRQEGISLSLDRATVTFRQELQAALASSSEMPSLDLSKLKKGLAFDSSRSARASEEAMVQALEHAERQPEVGLVKLQGVQDSWPGAITLLTFIVHFVPIQPLLSFYQYWASASSIGLVMDLLWRNLCFRYVESGSGKVLADFASRLVELQKQHKVR